MKPRKKNTGIHILEAGTPAVGSAEASERLQAVGLLAAGVAHDLNNLLGVILGNCEELSAQEGLPEPARIMLAEIGNAGNAAKKLAQGLLAFSTGPSSQREIVDLNESVRHMSSILARMTRNRVAWVQRLGVGLGMIAVQPGQMEQILMNLALNARDAMPHGGKLCIETASAYLDETYARQHPGVSPGSYVRLSVTDTGSGMDAEIQSRVFEPFFTTKPQGQGTGLGLSTVASMVHSSGGHIEVHSRLGWGTTFHIYFPRVQPEQAPSASTGLPLPTAAGTILLVEDSVPLRALTRRILESAGYAVIEASNSEEALATANTSAPITLLVTDVAMPGMSGCELAQKITAFRPEIKVLFMSGHCDQTRRTAGATVSPQAYLDKPFTRENLLAVVGELLHSALQPGEPARFSPGSVAISLRPPGKTPFACS